MKSIECIFESDRSRFAVLTARLNRHVSATHGGLAHVVDAVKKMGLIIVRLRDVERFGDYGGEYLAHDVLANR